MAALSGRSTGRAAGLLPAASQERRSAFSGLNSLRMVCMSRASRLSMAATCLASWSILDSSTPNRASSPAGKGGCGGEAPPAGLHDTGSVTLELDCAEARGAVAAGSEDSLVDATDGGAPDASSLGDQPGLLRLDPERAKNASLLAQTSVRKLTAISRYSIS